MALAETVDIHMNPFKIPHQKTRDGLLRFTVTHITPAWLDSWPSPRMGIQGVPG